MFGGKALEENYLNILVIAMIKVYHKVKGFQWINGDE